ncbi:MAG: dCTP deaminase [Euryarchaeota archaeon]|nr:dCTP deaminase [Euryarchaeota archaeon]
MAKMLFDFEIEDAIKKGLIKIEPFDGEKQLQPASIDLKLGYRIRFYKTLSIPYIDVKNANMEDYTEELAVQDGFILHPNQTILASTLEWIELSPYIAGKIDGRSSVGRLQVRVQNAGWIDPAFRGNITLELKNDGLVPVKLYPGMRICQLRLWQSDKPCERPYRGKYQDSKGTVGPRLYLDFTDSE